MFLLKKETIKTGLIAGFIAGFLAQEAIAFPEMVRHGYQSCATCHVSPSGGGALHNYGRSAGAEILSTWKNPGEENLFQGSVGELPDYLAIGGDLRSVAIKRGEYYRRFFMQKDIEVALTPNPMVTFDASFGAYGENNTLEYRRHFLKLVLNEMVTLRAGHFLPAYGIGFPDHTLPTRRRLGFGEGQETYNLEATLTTKCGELTITGVHGEETTVNMSKDDGYTSDSLTPTGTAVRGAWFATKTSQVGFSYLGVSTFDEWRQAYGIFAILSLFPELYLLAEYDRVFEDAKTFDVGTVKAGYEVFRGVHAIALADYEAENISLGGGAQWFPRPHLEILGQWKRHFSPYGELVDSMLFMVHAYH